MKKFTALFICLLMVITCGLAGCAGFSINKIKYYNEVLAEVGDTHITRYDLLSAYNSYGSNYYVSQMGESEQEALDSTLNLLIEREALYQYASNATNNAKYKPTAYQINSIVEEMFKSLDEQMDTYIKKAKKILDIEILTGDETTEDEEEAFLISNYKVTAENKRAEVKDTITYYTDATKTTVSQTKTNYYTISTSIVYNSELLEEPTDYDKLLEDKYLNDHTADGIVSAIQTKYFEKFKSNLDVKEEANSNSIYKKVLQLFTDDLIEYEKYLRDDNGKAYSKTTKDLTYRYVERNFESQIQSQYLENIRTSYLKDEQSQLSINLLLQEFNKLHTVSYNKYFNRESAYKTDMKDIGTGADSILYHPTIEEDDTQFGYFVHTLINFNDYQKSLYTMREKLTSESKKTEVLNEIFAHFATENGKIHPRDAETGLVDTSISYTFDNVIAMYNEIKNNNSLSYEQKLSAFIEFMFKFTGDTATLNAGMPYVVGTNDYSAMEKAFTEECIKLMNTGNAGAMSDAQLSNLDSLCITPYGIHLVMYVGAVDAYDFPSEDTTSAYIQFVNNEDDSNGVNNLYHKVLNPLTGETYFDMLFDAVYPQSGDAEVYTANNGYTDYEKGLIEIAKNDLSIVKYVDKIKGTKTAL